MALIQDQPGRFGLVVHSGYATPTTEYRMAEKLREAAEAIQDCLYYRHASVELEDDVDTKALLDECFVPLKKVVEHYFGPDEGALFYEPSTTEPEPESTEKPKKFGTPFKRQQR
jgi:hypothetical protein